MGIKDFSKIFNAARIIKWKDYAGQTIAIDAMWQIYNAALGTQSINTLTDASGKSTVHINVLFQRILALIADNVKQIWVFDHDSDSAEFHNPAKTLELAKRAQKRQEAKSELDKLTLNDFKNELDFGDETIQSQPQTTQTIQEDRINSLEKRVFRASKEMINDVVTLLQLMGIPYLFAPAGYEGEEIASYLVKQGLASAVYSGDTDPIAFGSPTLIRVNIKDKKIYEYTQSNIIEQIRDASDLSEITLEDVRKICVMAGTDFCEKTPKLGPKTILKKFNDVELTDSQTKALGLFARTDNININIEIINQTEPLGHVEEIINWLVDQKGFSKTRVEGAIQKAKNPKKAVAKKTRVTKQTKTVEKSPTKTAEKTSAKTAEKSPTKRIVIIKGKKIEKSD